MSSLSIISKSEDSSSISYLITPRKMKPNSNPLPLPHSGSTSGNPMGEEYLLCELAWWTRKGWLPPEGVKRVLENLETEPYPRVESNFNL